MVASDEADGGMVDRAIAGDRDALVTLLERHGPTVRRGLAGSIPRRWQSVLSLDDVIQQAYTDAFLGIGRFVPRGDGAFAAWLATLAKRDLLDALRTLEAQKRGGDRRRIQAPTNQDSFVELYELLGGTTTTPSRHAARNEARVTLERAIQCLPPVHRRVVQMYDIDGCPVEEVAAEFGRSAGAIYMLRARAHDRLCEFMGTASKYFSDVP